MYRDGTYSWIVLAASILTVSLAESVYFLPSLFLLEYADTFDVPKFKLGLIASLHSGVLSLVSIFSSQLIEWLGYRVAGCLGAVLMSCGLLLSSVAQNITILCVGYGIVAGLGTSLNLACAVVIVQHYFDRYCGLASGLVTCGYGIAQFSITPVMRLLIDNYGWRGAHVIHAAIVLNLLVCSALFRPTDQLKDREDLDIEGGARNMSRTYTEMKNMNDYQQLDNTNNQQKEKYQLLIDEPDISSSPDTPLIPSSKKRWYEALKIDLSLLKHGPFMLICASFFFSQIIHEISFKLVVSKAVSVGMSKFRASMLNAYMGVAELAMRVVLSFLADSKCINPILLMAAFTFASGVIISSYNLTKEYMGYAAISTLLGVCLAGIFGVKSFAMGILVGKERLLMAYGIQLNLISVMYFSVLPLAGLSYDITGSYDLLFYVIGLFGIIGSILMVAAAYYHRKANSDSSDKQ